LSDAKNKNKSLTLLSNHIHWFHYGIHLTSTSHMQTYFAYKSHEIFTLDLESSN